jgi:hypothetical protein
LRALMRGTAGGSLPVIIALTYRNTFFMIFFQEPDAFNKVQFPGLSESPKQKTILNYLVLLISL